MAIKAFSFFDSIIVSFGTVFITRSVGKFCIFPYLKQSQQFGAVLMLVKYEKKM